MASNTDITATETTAKQIEYEFEFEFTAHPGLFVRTDASILQAFSCIKTGLFKNAPVSRVKLFTVEEGKQVVAFTYDVNAAQKGNPPWSLLLTTL
jgi:hypothetical protein